MSADTIEKALNILLDGEAVTQLPSSIDSALDKTKPHKMNMYALAAQAVAALKQARWVLVLSPSGGGFVPQAFWADGSLAHTREKLDTDALCRCFYQQGTPVQFYQTNSFNGTGKQFPFCEAVSYQGVALLGKDKLPFAHIISLHDQPRDLDTQDQSNYILVARQVAQRLGHQQQLQAAFSELASYKQMIRCAPHLMSLVNRNYIYQIVSKGYEKFFGRAYDDICGASISDIHGEILFEQFMKRHIDECLQGGSVYSRRWVEPEGRDPFFIDVHQAPCYDESGNITGVVTSAHDITESKRAEEKVALIAHQDHLTGLPNRRFIFQRLEEELKNCKDQIKRSALFFIDLDGFKMVNDQFGHAMGDAVLEIVAKRLRRSVRKDDVLARIGGDEFVLLISNAWADDSALVEAQHWAEKLLDELSEPISISSQILSVSASIGVHIINQADGSSDDVIRQADIAMYCAKHDGQRRVRID